MTEAVLVATIVSGSTVVVAFGVPFLNARLTRRSLTRHLGAQNGRGDMYAIVERIDQRLEEHIDASVDRAHPRPAGVLMDVPLGVQVEVKTPKAE